MRERALQLSERGRARRVGRAGGGGGGRARRRSLSWSARVWFPDVTFVREVTATVARGESLVLAGRPLPISDLRVSAR